MRRRDREVTEHSEIMHILDSGKVLHLGLVDQGRPYIVPMNYGYVFEGEKLVFYLHGALEGRKLDIIRNNSDCCVQIECDVQPFSGKVACQYGCSYYSFDGFGTAKIVEVPQEKIKALSVLMKTQTGKDFEFNEKLKIVIFHLRTRNLYKILSYVYIYQYKHYTLQNDGISLANQNHIYPKMYERVYVHYNLILFH